MPQLFLYFLQCIGFNSLPKVCAELVSKGFILWGQSHVSWDVGQERAEKERHGFQYVVRSLGTDVKCGGVQIQHNNTNCFSLNCQRC